MEKKYNYYRGDRDAPEEKQLDFPKQSFLRNRPENYTPDAGLVEAVNLAILLNQPLLLTGDPGTGKTQLASHVAWELGLGDPLKFETRSTSLSKDLFYYFNSMGLFHAQHNATASKEAVDYITYNALGLAILRSNELSAIKHIVPETFVHPGPVKSVVLIDEIDKAPRDFPNDILNQVEDLYFRIPEIKNEIVRANPDKIPVTIITSNSEKNLPNAFLRRCIFYHIEFPDDNGKWLTKIALKRLRDLNPVNGKDKSVSDEFVADGVELFLMLNGSTDIRKKPATGELIVWLNALRKKTSTENPFTDTEQVMGCIGAIVKEVDDRNKAMKIVADWIKVKQY
jgi:MoxR-like ATPase